MQKILFINACVRPQSRTHRLACEVLDRLEGEAEEINLEREKIAPLDWESLQKRDTLSALNDFTDPMFAYARRFIEADEIVIAAPYWDLAFPASLRLYLEAVTVCGLSFRYTPEGEPQGLCRAKRIIYVTTAGGAIGGLNLGYDHVKALAQTFYGIREVVCFAAESLDIIGGDVPGIMEKTILEIQSSIGPG